MDATTVAQVEFFRRASAVIEAARRAVDGRPAYTSEGTVGIERGAWNALVAALKALDA